MKIVILFLALLKTVPFLPTIEKGLNHLYHEEYEKAESLFSQICDEASLEPLGYLFRAVLLDRYMIDFSTDRPEKEYLQLLDTTLSLCDTRLLKIRSRREEALLYFYKGSALSYRSTRYGRKGNFIKAIKDAGRAKSELSSALRMDSTLYDSYLGLGLYAYAMDFLSKYFAWLPFIDTHKEEAMEKVKIAMEKGKFTKTLAKEALIWMYLYDQNYPEARRLAEELCREYPNTRFSLWTLATCDTSAHRWGDALKNYQALIPLIEKGQSGCHYCLALLYYHIAKCYKELIRGREAYQSLDVSLSILKKERERKGKTEDLKKKIKKLRKALKRLDNP